eukprot:TRINITY_DN15727_c0_g1_i1.p1 TRINITY_DN15727_c0_g1~~TRINITY_DN15727_c0_g1_i1.p1  ORF type:complete len:325 (-),score=99.44 TRINITY_DN15727_c0_g1_i1:29-1003(-)
MKRAHQKINVHVASLIDLPCPVFSKIVISHNKRYYKFHKEIISQISNLSQTSQETNRIINSTPFITQFKYYLLNVLNIHHLSEEEEMVLGMLFKKRGGLGGDRKGWFYVYDLLWWVERRMDVTCYGFRKRTLDYYRLFLRSPHPVDFSILSTLYPYSCHGILQRYMIHLTQSKQVKLPPPSSIDMIRTGSYDKQEILKSIGNVFVMSDSEGEGFTSFTLNLNGSEFFCLVSLRKSGRDNYWTKCHFVDLKKKSRMKIKELEKLVTCFASAISDEMMYYFTDEEEELVEKYAEEVKEPVEEDEEEEPSEEVEEPAEEEEEEEEGE